MSRCSMLIALTLALASVPGLALPDDEHADGDGDVAAARGPVTPGEIAELIDKLDAESFDVRRRAVRTLADWARQPELQATLASQFHRRLLLPETSFEVRSQLTRLLEHLPPPETATLEPRSAEVDLAQIESLLAQLDDDSYGVRIGAAARLDWLLDQPEWISPIYLALKSRTIDAAGNEAARRLVERLLERARGAWLLSDPATWNLPEVSDDQIERWVDQLCADADTREGAWSPHELAERELLDLLARDEYVERVTEALQRRLDSLQLESDAARRVEGILHWTKPAMIAEFWQLTAEPEGMARRNLGVQYLLVDVPSLPEGGARASHFDRIDDRVANCVSGNSLSPGEYPVGVAFPHPNQEDAFFHLVNLPTPRRRLAYEYDRLRDESQRLIEISRRTVTRFLNEKRPMSQREALMLAHLDPGTMSRFVGQYFQAVDDRPYTEVTVPLAAGRLSMHGTILFVLAHHGTQDAVPGILQAIQDDRFLEPTREAPCDLRWCALLGIANRDPWPEVDAWLASLLERTDPLVLPEIDANASDILPPHPTAIRSDYPDLGATAGALLLKRAGIMPSEFGLRPYGLQVLVDMGCAGYRFGSDQGREELLRWWRSSETRRTSQAAHEGGTAAR